MLCFNGNPMKVLCFNGKSYENPIFQWKPGAIGAMGAMGAMVSAASRVLVWWTSRAGDAPWAVEEGEPPGHAGHHGLQGKCEEKSLRWWDWLIFMVIYDDLWHRHDWFMMICDDWWFIDDWLILIDSWMKLIYCIWMANEWKSTRFFGHCLMMSIAFHTPCMFFLSDSAGIFESGKFL